MCFLIIKGPFTVIVGIWVWVFCRSIVDRGSVAR
jgi:hypothetical protein